MLHHIVDILLTFGPVGVFLLSITDSLGVPLPAAVDALVIGVAWKTPDRAWIMAALATAGSVAGNLVLFLAARSGGRRWIKAPAPESPQKFRRWFRRYGLVTVFVPAVVPLLPLPLKVFVISAGVFHTGIGRFLAVILAARVIRYFGQAYLGMKLGEDGAKTFLANNAWTLSAVALGMAGVMYLLIRLNDRRRQPAS